MGKGKMDDAAAARIAKARGDKDEFARRAALSARQNRDTGSSKEPKNKDKDKSKSGSKSEKSK